VLEHVTEPWTAAAEFRRMLKPGGLVFIDYPFLVPVHGYPSHYYNATRAGLGRLFDEGFEQLRLDTLDNQSPDHASTGS
jgi:ubiquinone/menaquinone biosynthesis C-methylase UbiE